MTLEPKTLGDIFSEVQSEFHDDSEIHVIAVAGNPPDQYEATFDIPCTTKDEQGNVSIGYNHTVIISIPFGFPHFPPSCKPKSSIFHPDFDTEAICLGDFWSREKSIGDLIRYLGSMLRGEVYSLENAFNQEAAAWFRENSAKLPFSTPLAEDKLDSDDDQIPTLELSDDDIKLSILEDQDFVDDFAFPQEFDDVDTESPAAEPAPALLSEHDIDVERFTRMATQRRFQQLDAELSALPDGTDFNDKQQLIQTAAAAMEEARALYDEAVEYENQGNSANALESFREVERLVSDYPNIHSDIQRAGESADILSELTKSEFSTRNKAHDLPQQAQQLDKTGEEAADSEKDVDFDTEPEPPRKDRTREKKKASFFEESGKRPINIIPIVLTVGVFCLIATSTYFYFSLSSHLSEARQLYSECISNFAAKKFQVADKACTAAEDKARSIFLIRQSEVNQLQANIKRIMTSEEMRQGLLGNVLYNEKYVPMTTMTAHRSLEEMRTKGNQHLENSEWDHAAASFQKALELGRQLKDLPPDEFITIENNLKYAAFRSMLAVAENQVDKEDWSAAAISLAELQAQLATLSTQHQVEFHDYIDNMLAKSMFTSLKQQADTLFSQSDWAGAVSLFQKAAEAGRSLSETEPQQLADIKVNIARAELYSTINAGNRAFAAGKWDTAITEYERAAKIIEQNTDLLNLQEVEMSRRKLLRITLQTEIIRDRQAAERHREQNARNEAIHYLQLVTASIRQSGFANDPEFIDILNETHRAEQALRSEIFIEEKRQYLIENYTELVLRNYPGATPESLSSPSASFEKRLDNLYLFKLQCTESGQGRPLKLIMFYSYNPNTGSWEFYSQS